MQAAFCGRPAFAAAKGGEGPNAGACARSYLLKLSFSETISERQSFSPSRQVL